MRGWFPVTLAAIKRRRVSSGSSFEPQVGFSRAVRVGQRVLVSGTAPVWPDGSCDPDPANQARRCLAIILAALTELSVRVRLTSSGRARTSSTETIGRRSGASTGRSSARSVRRARWSFVAGLLDPRWRVEIEAEAILDAAADP